MRAYLKKKRAKRIAEALVMVTIRTARINLPMRSKRK